MFAGELKGGVSYEPTEFAEVHDDQKCYAKLESGVGKLNISFNGNVYHVVE